MHCDLFISYTVRPPRQETLMSGEAQKRVVKIIMSTMYYVGISRWPQFEQNSLYEIFEIFKKLRLKFVLVDFL